MRCAILFCVLATVSGTNDSDLYDVSKGPLVTHLVWLDMKIGDVDGERIVFGLFGRTAPITVRNFVDLARPRPYPGHRFGSLYRVLKGDEIDGGNNDCDSDYGEHIPKENFKLQHYGAGWIGAIPKNSERSTTCLFYIILKPTPDFDGMAVIFGKVIKGMDVIRKIENVTVEEGGRPNISVLIADCGTELANPPFRVARIAAVD